MKKRTILLVCAFILLFLIDRFCKYIALKNLNFQGFFLDSKIFKLGFTPTINKFFAFNLKIPESISLLILSIIIFWLIILFYQQTKTWQIPLALIIISAFSNLIDRVIYHGVIDFLNIQISTFQWPIFNAADVFITLGVFLLIKKILIIHKQR